MPETPTDARRGTRSSDAVSPSASDTGQPSAFAPAGTLNAAPTDIGAGMDTPKPTRTSAMNRPERLDQNHDDAVSAAKDKTVTDTAKLGEDAKRVRDDAGVVGEDLATLAREAVSALQRVADDLAVKAGHRAEEAVEAAKGVGVATVDNVTAVANDARHRAETGVEALSQSVARNPLTAVAIAAGVGMVFGMINRSDRR